MAQPPAGEAGSVLARRDAGREGPELSARASSRLARVPSVVTMFVWRDEKKEKGEVVRARHTGQEDERNEGKKAGWSARVLGNQGA